MEIIEARMPEEMPALRALMSDYLIEFDPYAKPSILWDDGYFEACRMGIEAGTHLVLLARESDSYVGFAILRIETMWYRPTLQLGHFEEVYVRAADRGKGFGKQLVERGKRWFDQRGVGPVSASVLESNPAALEFWKHAGFEVRVHHLFHG